VTLRSQEKREAVRELKRSCTHPKSALIKTWSRLQEVSPRDARTLGSIIARLETWQNRP
jgi:hypothetical protein